LILGRSNVVIPEKSILPISIPEDYIGRNVEILVFPIYEPNKENKITRNRTFDSVKLD
jgi:hypothetical protein